MKRGSALLIALWIILSLGVIVLSFSFEAKLQGGVNIYMQGKGRVKRLIEAGRIIGETVLIGSPDAKQWSEDEDFEELFEEDRWFAEKRDLKYASNCVIGPILLDAENPDSGTVTVEISISSSDGSEGINVNTLNSEDSNYIVRWQQILDLCGVPGKDNFRTEDGESINLQHRIIACWNDYRDEDETRTAIEGVECGAEKRDYEEYYDEHEDDYAEEDRFEPANGEIADLKELSRVLCFREYPAVLTGGVLNPWESKKDQIVLQRGLVNAGILGVAGDGKVNVNRASADMLLTIPGVFREEELEDEERPESRELAEAIVKCRKIKPQGYDVPEDRDEWGYGEFTSDWWSDLCQRVSDEFDLEIGTEAKDYLVAQSAGDGVFKMKITASLTAMEYSAECECYVKDKKVRYISWREY